MKQRRRGTFRNSVKQERVASEMEVHSHGETNHRQCDHQLLQDHRELSIRSIVYKIMSLNKRKSVSSKLNKSE